MSTYIKRKKGYGPKASLPAAYDEGQELFSTDTLEHTIDMNGERVRVNPPKDFNKIENRPDVDKIINSIATFKRLHEDVKIYGVHWDKTSSSMTRLYDSKNITTDTSNFVYAGSVNASYNNPFDALYPWSECKQCNVDLTAYRALSSGDDIRDAVVAWYGDPDFTTDGSNGFVGRYTPEFWYYGFEDGNGKVVLIADGEVDGFIHHLPSIRSHGFAVDDGNGGVTSDDGQPMTNVAVSSIHSKATSCGFTLRDIYEVDAETALYMVEFANVNSQSKLGNGSDAESYESNSTIISAEIGATTVLLPIAGKNYYIPGATLDFATVKGGVDLSKRRTIVSSVDYDSSYCQVSFTPALDLTTNLYPTIHGKNNADSIGNKSGYIGVNSKNNAWYRGAILYANRWQYTLGVYRQTGTNHLWLCDKETCDNYDALNTTDHFDTGITQYTLSSGSWQNVGDYGVPFDKLAAFGIITEAGALTGDQQYCPLPSVGNTVCLLGGGAGGGSGAGVFCAYWDATASNSSWNSAAILLLR